MNSLTGQSQNGVRAHSKITPPQLFATVSLLLILGVMAATSLTQSSFYRDAFVKRESMIIHDVVEALVREEQFERELSVSHLKDFDTPIAQAQLQHTFRRLTNVRGEARIKIFNADGKIAWSDEPRLVGTSFTRNPQDLARALNGEVRAVFDPKESLTNPLEGLPSSTLVEFYVPFSLHDGPSSVATRGVLALYRSPEELNSTIRNGLFLLWAVTGIGGLMLFAALYSLFRRMYYGKREAESQFARLSAEHTRLMQIEKLSALGQMAGEIAHQINNPLVGVINLTELAEREIDNRQRVMELLAEVRRAGNECRSFVQRMLRVTKVARSEPQLADMNLLVNETITFFQQSLGGKPVITLQSPAEPVMLNVDPVLVRNALFNLIHNAALADPQGSVLVSLVAGERNGVPGCAIMVSDSGPGLAPDVAAKLFTPFFTTRPGGTGLGLSIAQNIAVQHHGHISAENNPDGGARFMMWLPASKQSYEFENPPG